jgi:hypothetical protein
MTRILPAFVLLALITACGITAPPDLGEFGFCSSSKPCPDGQFCFNGTCAPGCQTNGNCASDQYCDTEDGPPYFCKNKTVSSCPATPCGEGFDCVSGLCTAKQEQREQCSPRPDFNDGCDKYSVCYDEDEDGPTAASCYSFPACAEDGSCPVGQFGAVCNDGYIPNKGRFCMPATCKDASHCPSNWKCVRFQENQVLGICSSGGAGSFCQTAADCTSGTCSAMPGFPGICF